MIKIIFVDIDGTLRNEERIVTERTKNSIKNICSLGINVVLCTGRSRDYAIQVGEEANTSKYFITSSGAEVYDLINNKVVYYNGIDANACEEIYNLAVKYNARFIMHSNGVKVVNRIKHQTEVLLEGDIKEFLSKNTVLQCIITDTDIEKVKGMRKYIDDIKGVKISNQSKYLTKSPIKPIDGVYFDVVKSEVSKGEGIKALCKYLNISLEDTIGIGDDKNDTGMFETVGHSIAMGNANDDIKALVDEVIGSNDNDGLAIYFESLYNELRI